MAIALPPASLAPERVAAARLRAPRDRRMDEAMADVAVFARQCHIQVELGPDLVFGDVAWLWQYQVLELWARNRMVVVLKARQLGVSWLAAIYVLWSAMRAEGQSVLLISKGQDDADKLMQKVAFIYHSLPDWKPRATVKTRSLRFPSINSEIESMPASEGVGRSRTATLIVLDEHGHQPNANSIFLSIKPAVEKGQIISISTANGVGALHSRLYMDAKNSGGANGWTAVFIPAHMKPGRTGDWRLKARAEAVGMSDGEFEQEYPERDIDAFLATGRPVFSHQDLGRQVVEAPTDIHEHGAFQHIYRRPEAGHRYVIGADVAEGLIAGDWSSASVHDRDTGEQVAMLRGHWTPDFYAERIDRLARAYGAFATAENPYTVLIGVERNNHGHATILRLSQLQQVPGTPYAIFRAKDRKYGWLTTPASRPVLVDQLEQAIRTGEVKLHDAETVDQFSKFSWNEQNKPEAQQGFHDDDVIAVGIAVQMRRKSFGLVLGADMPVPARVAA